MRVLLLQRRSMPMKERLARGSESIFLEGLERRGASAQGIVFSHTVEDMNTAIVQQGRLGNSPFNRGRAPLAAFERFVGDFLNRFKAVTFFALIFVERHDG
jgi:hypothetical protein